MLLFHRTTILQARLIMQRGFEDDKWSFGDRDTRTGQKLKKVGVWLTDRPTGQDEGPEGDAVLAVRLSVSEESLAIYELKDVFADARLWVAPAHLLNRHTKTRIHEVDPGSSWWHEAPNTNDYNDIM